MAISVRRRTWRHLMIPRVSVTGVWFVCRASNVVQFTWFRHNLQYCRELWQTSSIKQSLQGFYVWLWSSTCFSTTSESTPLWSIYQAFWAISPYSIIFVQYSYWCNYADVSKWRKWWLNQSYLTTLPVKLIDKDNFYYLQCQHSCTKCK